MTDREHSRLPFVVDKLQTNAVRECNWIAPLPFTADGRQHAPLVIAPRVFVRLGHFRRQEQRVTPADIAGDDSQEQMFVALAAFQYDEITIPHEFAHITPSVFALINKRVELEATAQTTVELPACLNMCNATSNKICLRASLGHELAEISNPHLKPSESDDYLDFAPYDAK
ncbi:hypothetical protein [Trinickia sp.]|uniref:hypothetical protein n=1 Tax=Trinickia sp. TaxID=2571163 RepID=UPI003F7E0981